MIERHITYSVRQLLSKRITVNGGFVTDTALGTPDSSLSLGDTLYHIHLVKASGEMMSEEIRREAMAKAEENLKTRYANNRSTLTE
jgi:hypothetical protein